MILSLICVGLLSAFAANGQDSLGVRVAGSYNLYQTRSVTVAGEYAFVSGYHYLTILEIADPENIGLVGQCSGINCTYDVALHGDHAFLADLSAGLKVIDISDLERPRLLAALATQECAYSVVPTGDYTYLANDDLLVIDTSDPARPEIVATINPGEHCLGVAVSGNYAYVAGSGFFVVDISNPLRPRQVASVGIQYAGRRVTVQGDRAYLTENYSERQGNNHIYRSNLRIYDISEPERPRMLGVFGELDHTIWDVAVSGDHAYLAASSHLHVLDVSDPENPVEIGWYRTNSGIMNVAVVEPFVYAAQYNGLTIYDCSNAIGQPDLELAEEDRAHDFGEVVVGLSGQWDFPVGNAGHFRLTVDGMEVDDEAFVLHSERSRWRWQEGFPAGAAAHDQRLGGVEFDGENFYVTGGAGGEMVNWVYVFSREGELVRRFGQFAESPWGMRDLAWDGELLWGADGATVYGFTTDGELEAEFQAPLEVVRSLAWDPQRELLWLADLTSPIFGVDREGNIAVELERPGVRVYGMGWYPEDPDGCQLYVATWDPDRPLSLHKVDVESGEVFLVRENLDARIGERCGGGLAVTQDLNPPCWDLVALVDGAPDAVEVWQLTDYYRDEAFVIPAEDEASVTVEFTPGEARVYEGILTIISDDEDEPEVQVSLEGSGRINRAPEWARLPEAVEIQAGELIQFEVQGQDPDENPLLVTLERGELPYRARLEDHGDGSAAFSWQTDERDLGRHAVVFILSDRVTEVQGEVPLVVSAVTGVGSHSDAAPFVYRMDAPRPNPFNQAVTLRFTLPLAQPVLLAVYNTTGREVARLVDGELDRGTHNLVWNADHISEGVYIARLSTPLGVRVVKMVMVK